MSFARKLRRKHNPRRVRVADMARIPAAQRIALERMLRRVDWADVERVRVGETIRPEPGRTSPPLAIDMSASDICTQDEIEKLDREALKNPERRVGIFAEIVNRIRTEDAEAPGATC